MLFYFVSIALGSLQWCKPLSLLFVFEIYENRYTAVITAVFQLASIKEWKTGCVLRLLFLNLYSLDDIYHLLTKNKNQVITKKQAVFKAKNAFFVVCAKKYEIRLKNLKHRAIYDIIKMIKGSGCPVTTYLMQTALL